MTARRTQLQRRESTIAKLLDATIAALAAEGFHKTSIGRICRRAGVSQGGLFRHFPSRTALLSAATEEICRRHLAGFAPLLDGATSERLPDVLNDVIHFLRNACRSPTHAAWREVLVAARTDPALAKEVAGPIYRFEQAIMDLAVSLPGADPTRRDELGTLFLSLAHMFDSEAVTIDIVNNPVIDDLRHTWAVATLRAALAG